MRRARGCRGPPPCAAGAVRRRLGDAARAAAAVPRGRGRRRGQSCEAAERGGRRSATPSARRRRRRRVRRQTLCGAVRYGAVEQMARPRVDSAIERLLNARGAARAPRRGGLTPLSPAHMPPSSSCSTPSGAVPMALAPTRKRRRIAARPLMQRSRAAASWRSRAFDLFSTDDARIVGFSRGDCVRRSTESIPRHPVHRHRRALAPPEHRATCASDDEHGRALGAVRARFQQVASAPRRSSRRLWQPSRRAAMAQWGAREPRR